MAASGKPSVFLGSVLIHGIRGAAGARTLRASNTEDSEDTKGTEKSGFESRSWVFVKIETSTHSSDSQGSPKTEDPPCPRCAPGSPCRSSGGRKKEPVDHAEARRGYD